MACIRRKTAPARRPRIACGGAVLLAAMALWPRAFAQADEDRRNYFGDPFVQATAGLAGCPLPAGPEITRAQMLAQSHYRAERGVSCYQAGRCRLPNAYLYDAEIIPRAKKAILAAGRFEATSIWLEGQRRWVWLKGCVRSEEEAKAAEELVRGLDDVESVVNELTVRQP